MTYKLIDLIQDPISANVWMTGKISNKRVRVRFVPGREYSDHVDDPVYIDSLRDLYKDYPFSADLEARLIKEGAKYTIPPRTCNCQGKKLRVWYMEVIE